MVEGKAKDTQTAVGALTLVQPASGRQTAIEGTARHNFQVLLLLNSQVLETRNRV
jgi:hypothetical protein